MWFKLLFRIIVIGIHDEASQAPVITRHPQNVQIIRGNYGILEVTAYGAMPLNYQWYHNHNIIYGMYVELCSM